MSLAISPGPAGRWLLESGIQEPSGGFARFYDAETGKNRAVSTEISGYAASALIYLFKITGNEAFLARARNTACFLIEVWDEQLQTFPFEHPSPSPHSDHHAYFFDCGIIVRGLLAVWRETKDDRLLDLSIAASHSMIADFHGGEDYHPILALPGKDPLPRTDRWSRAPGCYQLKSAMAWWDLADVTGDIRLRTAYLEMLNAAIATHSGFLPGSSCPERVMDRLHPYCYFLEGLTPMLERQECLDVYSHGLAAISKWLRQLSNTFVRSDVYAQLLRARIYGYLMAPETITVDNAEAAEEARALAAFQAVSDDPRINGGFYFGTREGRMSHHVNPVSTVFALQALEMWQQYQSNAQSPPESKSPCRQMLI